MAWDANRPVPWLRLVREWFIYVAIMAAVFVVFFRDQGLLGILAGLLVSGPLYLAIGYAMAKLGYQRRSVNDRRNSAATSTTDTSQAATDTVDAPRPRPAPTKRTGGGTRPNRSTKRKR